MKFWLDLFTGTSWREFRDAGGEITGFSERCRNIAKGIEIGDVLLCYMTGVMRWVGALEVLGRSDDTRPLWSVAEFPVRFRVRPMVLLDAEHGVPMEDLEGRVDFFSGPTKRG